MSDWIDKRFSEYFSPEDSMNYPIFNEHNVKLFIRSLLKDQPKVELDEEKVERILAETLLSRGLIDMEEDFCFVCGHPISKDKINLLIKHLAKSVCKKFSQPVSVDVKYPKQDPRIRGVMPYEQGLIAGWNNCLEQTKKLNGESA